MFQKPLLLPWRTALHNVGLPAERPNKIEQDGAADAARAAALLRMAVGLEDFAGAYPHQLSGGMQNAWRSPAR